MWMRQLFDPESSTYTYLLADDRSGEAVLIDPVLEQVDRDLSLVRELGLRLVLALDTHVHADHVTALGTLRERTGATTVLSERGGAPCADRLVKEGDRIRFGQYELEVRETPGHTNGCVSYVSGDHAMVFTGDALLIRGCGRTDFQQGDARKLYRSVHEKILSLPDDTLVYPAHDYKGRTVSSVREEKQWNPRLGGGRTIDEFVRTMEELKLAYPKKMDVAVPSNLHCGLPWASVETPRARWAAPVETAPGGFPEITPAWVAQHAREVRLVDVRESDEYDGPLGHVGGAELVPLATLGARAASWDREVPVVTICRSGGRSAKAANQLLAMGFGAVASMRGGMVAWNEQSLPVERGSSAKESMRQGV